MRMQGNLKTGLGLVVAVTIGIVVFGIRTISTDEETNQDTKEKQETRVGVTGEDIAKAVMGVMEARDKKNADFPVSAPDGVYTDAMMQLNEFGKKVDSKIEVMKETDNRLISAIEKLTEMDLETRAKSAESESQIHAAIDEIRKTLETMSRKESNPTSAPVSIPVVESGKIDELAEKLAKMEERLTSKPIIKSSEIPDGSEIPAEDLRLSWDRPPVIKIDPPIPSTLPPALLEEKEVGLLRSGVSAVGETVESSTDILSGAMKGAVDVGSGTVKDLTRTAGKTIGGASVVTGEAVGGASSLGKSIWKKIW